MQTWGVGGGGSMQGNGYPWCIGFGVAVGLGTWPPSKGGLAPFADLLPLS